MNPTSVVGRLSVAFLLVPLTAALAADEPLVFNTTTPTNDLRGTLAAQVLLAQSQIIPARPREGDHQPHLIASRTCLLLVRPLEANDATPMEVTALGKNGQPLGSLRLDPPATLPATAYFLDGLPKERITFTPGPGPVALITSKKDLEQLSEQLATFLLERLRSSALVEIETADGLWVRDVYLPATRDLEDKMVRVRSRAAYPSTIHYGDRAATIARCESLQFKVVKGQWVLESELENQGLTYAADAWSGVLPAEWIAPGLTLAFRQGKLSGDLTELKVGAPTELLLHTIDLGMLVPPRGKFLFAKDPTAHREYFQTVPTSRMIVSQYAPLSLRQVMLPTGTLLQELDPSKGDWHNGTMRQRIGKELISHGIDNANYGINSSAGEGEDGHPYVAAQLTAHNSSGRYSNGLVTHGGSGGGGIVTLDDTLGNEFSHEVGHNYGLGHYVGGFEGSVHRGADQTNSTWGWDADRNRFLPNFSPFRSGKDTCLENRCQRPFEGRSFGLDAMAGGAPLSGFNRFTLYTPYSAALIQTFFESKAVFDPGSPTGFRKWNDSTGEMEPYAHRIEIAEQITAAVSDVGEDGMAQLLADYELVRVSMQDGNWAKEVRLPAAAPANRGRCVTIDQGATYDSFLSLNGERVKMSRGFQRSYTSDGKQWNEGQAADQWLDRKPQAFGIPVVTLVGYYDPRGELTSYIYPPLHGAYGFTYADDRERITEEDPQLVVETREGTRRFRLAKHRVNAQVMNKFHINVPAASGPQTASILCRGKVVDKKTLTAPEERPTYTRTPAP